MKQVLLIIAAFALAGFCGLPRLHPSVLRLNHQAAMIYDTLLLEETGEVNHRGHRGHGGIDSCL
jgi:hypothetical protein